MIAGTARQLGPYTIDAPLGAGGMGAVYRATDTRLGRIVAIKILRDESPTRYLRFEREARAVSRLNHPHICGLHDIGNENGVRFLVMEYVDGETLARRLLRGPLPQAEVLRSAIEIADALDHAHRAGVVHRDLKPSNVMLTATGAKLLDFGLASWLSDRDGRDSELDGTITEEGTILGTVRYMSPEQLEGRRADTRSDIFAFGALVYEMATGRAAFDGPSKASVVAAVLERVPEPLSVARTAAAASDPTPPLLDAIVARCLSKSAEDRWQTARDLREALGWIAVGGPAPSGASARSTGASGRSRSRRYMIWGAAVVLATLIAVSSRSRRPPTAPPPRPVVRTAILLPPGQSLSRRYANDYPLAVSPDGTRVAYVAATADRDQLYLRDLGELEARPLAGTTGARHPFFSADGAWLAFFSDDALLKLRVSGGPLQRICALAGMSAGGSWGPGETIVFGASGAGLFKVAATGGTPQRIDGADGGQWPQILPDGSTVLFTRNAGIYSTSLNGGGTRTLARTDRGVAAEGVPVLGAGAIAQARVLPTGHLVYGQDPGTIRGVAIDMASLVLKGSPVALVDRVFRASASNSLYFAVSESGLLVYAPEDPRRSLVWADRLGRTTSIVGAGPAAFRIPRLSPDETRIAVAIDDDTRRADLWVYEAATGTRVRLTSSGHNLASVWTPDGTYLTHSTGRDLVVEPARGGGPQRSLLPKRPAPLVGQNVYSSSWSASGRDLLCWTTSTVTAQDLWVIHDGTPRPLFTGRANEKFGVFSPSGNWIAYQSDESGRDEVYVARYPTLLERKAVSNHGGVCPIWSADGRELFYRQGTAMMAVAVRESGTLRTGPPELLFDDPSLVGMGWDLRFDVSRDAQRFLTPRADDGSLSRQVVVVQSWTEDVTRRVPAR